jgi:hypothetical protein
MSKLLAHRIVLQSALFVLLLAAFPWAADMRYVAVFETMNDADSALTEGELRYLTNELRKIALEKLPKANYSVMTRDNILLLLPPGENAAECFEGQCLVDVGRNIGAEYAVQGTAGKFGQRITLSVEAYSTLSAKLVASFTAESETVDGLLIAMRQNSPAMFANILDNDGLELPKPPPEPTPPPASEAPPTPEPPPAPVVLPTPEPPVQNIDPQIETTPRPGTSWSTWTAVGLDVLGAAGLAFGIWQGMRADDLYGRYKDISQGTPDDLESAWKKVDQASTMRNIGYIAGGVLLAGGITLHIVF